MTASSLKANQSARAENHSKSNRSPTPNEVQPSKKLIFDAPKPNSHEDQSKKQRKKVPVWLKFTVNLLTLAAVIWYAYEARKQRISTDNTLSEIQKQTKLMTTQEVGTYGASIYIDGPWITVIGDDFDYFQNGGLGLSFKNSGKITAKDFTAEFTMTKMTLPNFKQIGAAQAVTTSKAEIRPPERTSGQQFNDAAVIRFDVSRFTDNDLRLIRLTKETIEISGQTRYDDGFGNQDGEQLCFDYIVTPAHTFKTMGTTGGQGWLTCTEARYLAKQATRWTQGNH